MEEDYLIIKHRKGEINLYLWCITEIDTVKKTIKYSTRKAFEGPKKYKLKNVKQIKSIWRALKEMRDKHEQKKWIITKT